MIITCEQRHRIGYIYLQKPNLQFPIWDKIGDKKIEKYLDGVKPEITLEKANREIEEKIMRLGVSDKSYLEELADEIFYEEYLNDKYGNGYIIGMELTISKEELIENVKEQVYKIYMIDYQQREYVLLTLERKDKVFDRNNILYAANGNKDTYYIVSVIDDTAYIRGILTRRVDLYPIDYLKEVHFILN